MFPPPTSGDATHMEWFKITPSPILRHFSRVHPLIPPAPSQLPGEMVGHLQIFLVGCGDLYSGVLETSPDGLDAVLDVLLVLHQHVEVRLVEHLG